MLTTMIMKTEIIQNQGSVPTSYYSLFCLILMIILLSIILITIL